MFWKTPQKAETPKQKTFYIDLALKVALKFHTGYFSTVELINLFNFRYLKVKCYSHDIVIERVCVCV